MGRQNNLKSRLQSGLARVFRRIALHRTGREILWRAGWIRITAIKGDRWLDLRGYMGAMGALAGRARTIRPRVLGGGVGGLVLVAAVVVLGVKLLGPRNHPARASVPAPDSVRKLRNNQELQFHSEPAVLLDQPLQEAAEAPPEVDQVIDRPVDPLTALQLELAEARQRCLQKLYTSEAYQSAKLEADQLEARVRALRQEDRFGELPRASMEWIQAKSVVGRLTAEALRSDPKVHQNEMVLRGLGIIPTPWQELIDQSPPAAQDRFEAPHVTIESNLMNAGPPVR